MKLLSLNYGGLAYPSKRLTLKQLVLIHQSKVIFLQETLCHEAVIVPNLKSFMSHWDFMGVDSKGHSWGLVMGWNTSIIKAKSIWAKDSVIGENILEEGLRIMYCEYLRPLLCVLKFMGILI
jgi:hypothetical protein